MTQPALRALLAALCCLVVAAGPSGAEKLPKPGFPLSAAVDPSGAAVLSWKAPSGVVPRQTILLRSTTDLRTTKDGRAFPIARLDASGLPGTYADRLAPQGVPLWYQLKLVAADGRAHYSSAECLTLPAPLIPALARPSLLIDKSAYTLALLDKGVPVRRFPIALGANPVNRKLHLDRASTPEGFYRISGLQPRAEFYRAYDLDYPNEIDRIRYRVMADRKELPHPLPPIGGEIQIHGDGIASNWTWGCIALRNDDMDLLFSLPQLSRGAPVVIAGSELTAEDLESQRALTEQERAVFMEHLVEQGLASGRSPRHWLYGLCKYQAQNGLLMTGILDRSTRRHLERQVRLTVSR